MENKNKQIIKIIQQNDIFKYMKSCTLAFFIAQFKKFWIIIYQYLFKRSINFLLNQLQMLNIIEEIV